jgi:hypothetical protein
MNDAAMLEIARMRNSFAQTGDNADLTRDTYKLALQDLSSQSVIEAAQRFTMGDVEGQSKTFAPSIAEFVTEARKRQEYIDLKAKPRLPAPRYFPGPLAPFQVRQQKRLSENSHLPVLFENINSDQWRKMSAAKEIPVGAKWCASLGIVYGPEKRTA